LGLKLFDRRRHVRLRSGAHVPTTPIDEAGAEIEADFHFHAVHIEAGAGCRLRSREIVLDFGKLAMYRRGYVTVTGGRHTMEVLSEPVVPTRHLHRLGRTVYLVIEIDLIVIDLLNRMHRYIAV